MKRLSRDYSVSCAVLPVFILSYTYSQHLSIVLNFDLLAKDRYIEDQKTNKQQST